MTGQQFSVCPPSWHAAFEQRRYVIHSYDGYWWVSRPDGWAWEDAAGRTRTFNTSLAAGKALAEFLGLQLDKQ